MNARATHPAPRGTRCASHLHDHPLPRGYTDADVVAEHRLAVGWLNQRCPRCSAYGWVAPAGDLFCTCQPTPEKGHICVCGPEWLT